MSQRVCDHCGVGKQPGFNSFRKARWVVEGEGGFTFLCTKHALAQPHPTVRIETFRLQLAAGERVEQALQQRGDGMSLEEALQMAEVARSATLSRLPSLDVASGLALDVLAVQWGISRYERAGEEVQHPETDVALRERIRGRMRGFRSAGV